MKKIVILSHCILNPFCEAEEPDAKDFYRLMTNELMRRNIGIVQLPCPELIHQGIHRESIYPDSKGAEKFAEFCQNLVKDIVKNIIEYNKNGIEIVAMLGIDTSPSCSVIDPSAFMMKEIISAIEAEKIPMKLIDMPVTMPDDTETWIEKIVGKE